MLSRIEEPVKGVALKVPGKMHTYSHAIPVIGDMPISSPLNLSRIPDWPNPEQGIAAKEGNARLESGICRSRNYILITTIMPNLRTPTLKPMSI